MQSHYDPLLNDFSSFMMFPSEDDSKDILSDPWASFHNDLDKRLTESLSSVDASSPTLSPPYSSPCSSDSDFYGFGGLVDFAESPISDLSSSPRSVFDDPTLSPPSSITSDRDETFAPSGPFAIPPTSLFAFDVEVPPTIPQQCPSPLVTVSELSNLPTSRTSSRSSSPTSTAGRARASYDSDEDADGEIESGSEFELDDSDDEDYVDGRKWSTPRSPRKKNTKTTRARAAPAPKPSSASASRSTRSARAHRYSPYASPRTSPSSPSSSSDGGLPRRRPELKHTSARNVQLSPSEQMAEPVAKGSKRWRCPHCDYVQQNHRHPDLKRHIAGHFQKDKFVCCGVPTYLRNQYGVSKKEEAGEWQGEDRVGGCWRVMSRRDALIRHLKNPRKPCVNNEVLPEKVLTSPK
ncbi:hypothetical protein PsYK624_043840 [Phanerochaete sordida]|uniref:C2H2-type domain-containing protein n=1 Tax=Phanerochaete sordida TaxID=48140 RepID=A0A9P3LAE1_9APHY|nr:hypothetical protein PsYK624_043840 [Phanerochaete sordida]